MPDSEEDKSQRPVDPARQMLRDEMVKNRKIHKALQAQIKLRQADRNQQQASSSPDDDTANSLTVKEIISALIADSPTPEEEKPPPKTFPPLTSAYLDSQLRQFIEEFENKPPSPAKESGADGQSKQTEE